MVKIYLDNNNRLVIDRYGVKRYPSYLWNYPIVDENSQTIEIPNILNKVSFSSIVNNNGENYMRFFELEDLLFYFFNNKSGDVVFSPIVPIRNLSQRIGSLLVDSISGRNADVLLPVSSFNGIDSEISCLSDCFDFTVGKFMELTIDLSAVNTTQYFLSSSATQGIRYNGSTFLIISNNQFASVSFTTPSVSDRLRIERESLSVFKIYVNDVFIGDITNALFGELKFNTVGARADGLYYFNGNVCDINFNDTVFVPIPHLGYGFYADGSVLDLVNSNAFIEYKKEGSTWLLDKGCVKRGDSFIPNKPNGEVALPLVSNDVIIEASAFLNNSDYYVDMSGGVIDDNILKDNVYSFFKKTDVDIWNDDIRTDDHYDGFPLKWRADELFSLDDFLQDGISKVVSDGDGIVLYNKNLKQN